MTGRRDKLICIPTKIEELSSHSNVGFDRFVKAIEYGKIKPGMTLTQSQLCKFLDLPLSRTREALVLLVEYGLISVKARAGLTVVKPELAFIRENYQFRILIETEALKAFVVNVPNGWLKAVRAHQKIVLSELQNDLEQTRTLIKFIALDEYIHTSIVAALKNEAIQSTHLRLLQNTRMITLQQGPFNNNHHLLCASHEHLDFFNSIQVKNLEQARLTLLRHFEASIYRMIVSF